MIFAAYSPSLSEQASLPHIWPATTRPWIVVTMRYGDETKDPHLVTYIPNSGLELLGSVSLQDGVAVNVVCSHLEGGEWRVRQVEEVLVGTLGQETVVLMRDQAGSLFCPDAPELPVDQIAQLVTVCTTEATPRRSVPTEDHRGMHAAIARAMKSRVAAPILASSTPAAAPAPQSQPAQAPLPPQASNGQP